MIKKITALIAALFLAMVALSTPAFATNDKTPSEGNNKKVNLCHATGVDGKYVDLEVPVHAFYNSGHIDHAPGGNRDIYEGFTWTDNRGVEHVVPSQGDQSLLAFPNCERPKEPVVVNVTVTPVDKCGLKDDLVTAGVLPLNGAVVHVTNEGSQYTVDVTANEGFTLNLDNTWSAGEGGVFTKVFTLSNEPCDLPETGSATTNAVGGVIIVGLIVAGVVFLLRRRTV